MLPFRLFFSFLFLFSFVLDLNRQFLSDVLDFIDSGAGNVLIAGDPKVISFFFSFFSFLICFIRLVTLPMMLLKNVELN